VLVNNQTYSLQVDSSNSLLPALPSAVDLWIQGFISMIRIAICFPSLYESHKVKQLTHD